MSPVDPDGAAVARRQRPEIADGDRLAVDAVQLADELVVVQIVGVDCAVAEIADQQVAGELAEILRRDRQSPRRVERPVGGDTGDQFAAERELVDVTVARAGHVVVLELVLLGVGHEQMAVQHLRVERRVAGRQVAVGEAVHLLPLALKTSTVPCRKFVAYSSVVPFFCVPIASPL